MVSHQELELLSRQINQAHRTAVQAHLARAGLSEVGHPMLLTILKSGETDPQAQCCAQRELAELLYISPAAVANSLKSLEKGGYVRREPCRDDARRNQVLLTDKGRQAVEGCCQVFQTVSDRMLDGFTPEERSQLLAFRQRMLNNLRAAVPADDPEKEGFS